jgi:hypothetical protein
VRRLEIITEAGGWAGGRTRREDLVRGEVGDGGVVPAPSIEVCLHQLDAVAFACIQGEGHLCALDLAGGRRVAGGGRLDSEGHSAAGAHAACHQEFVVTCWGRAGGPCAAAGVGQAGSRGAVGEVWTRPARVEGQHVERREAQGSQTFGLLPLPCHNYVSY